jgi:MFS family permease
VIGEGLNMFGRTVELRRAVHRTAVRVGLAGSLTTIAMLCAVVVLMQAALPTGRLSDALAHALVPILAVLAVASAGVTVFASPLVFRYGSGLASAAHGKATVFAEAVQSDSAYERAAGQLGLLAIGQMLAASIPTVLGFVVFVAGASVSVFSVFVALSVVILAAVCPRSSEWDDEVERLVSQSRVFHDALEDSPA